MPEIQAPNADPIYALYHNEEGLKIARATRARLGEEHRVATLTAAIDLLPPYVHAWAQIEAKRCRSTPEMIAAAVLANLMDATAPQDDRLCSPEDCPHSVFVQSRCVHCGQER